MSAPIRGYVTTHATDWAKAWLRWFWRLPVTAKIPALAAHVIAFDVLAGRIAPGRAGFEIVGATALVLALLVVVSLLVGSTDR